MADSPTTRPSLLVRLRDPQDAPAWSQFVDLYGPLIYDFARTQGLQDADAADLMQEVLQAVNGAIGRLQYDPKRGTFRGWLFTVVRNKLRNFLAKRQRQGRGSGDTGMLHWLEQQPGRDEDQEALWDQEYTRRLFARAAEQVRGDVHESTWQAFWQTAVEGKNPQEVAQSLQTTLAAVYLAKSRVMARLKETIEDFERTAE
jgi:RNA polymerase sigma factor (sigma-70 family)